MRRSLVMLVLSAFVVACGDMRPTAPGRSTGGTGGTGGVFVPKPTHALVGSWSFSRFFYDDAGAFHLSQTVWTFGSDGSVTRTVYADNITAGYGDVVVTRGRWTALPATVDVLFDGSPAPARYEYRFEGGALILSGIAFVRLAS